MEEESVYLVGVVVEEGARTADGKYRFIYMGSVVENDKNILHIYTKNELTDEEIINRFAGTNGFQRIIRE
jgi:hypothetical protein